MTCEWNPSPGPGRIGWTGLSICIDRAASVDLATQGPFLGHQALFRFANQMLHGLATLRSEYLETQPYLLALWDYREDTLAGGAADFIDQWGDIARLRILDLDDVLSGVYRPRE